MAADTQANGTTSHADSPRKLKILMLHGYTQTGPLFHAKTRALEKVLHKSFPPAPQPTGPKSTPRSAPPGSLPAYPGGVELIYPTGPRRLQPADIPGYDVTAYGDAAASDYRAWWQRSAENGEYLGLEEGLATIGAAIRDAGGVDGVVGFSQGGAAAAMVASLLEDDRAEAFDAAARSSGGIKYPNSFLGERSAPTAAMPSHGRLKFAVIYSGFYAPYPPYEAFYEPKIKTPMLHFIGSLDSVVEESRSLALVNACTDARVVYHPGGHFVPIGKDMVGQLVAFIRGACEESAEITKEGKEEDMDTLF